MARAPFVIAGTEIKAGTRATVEVPVAKLYTHTPCIFPLRWSTAAAMARC